MNNPKVKKYEQRSRKSIFASTAGIILAVAGFIASAEYSDMAEHEKIKDPEYRAELERRRKEEHELREKELAAQQQKYLLEQEKLKVDAENRRLDEERKKVSDALAEIDQYAEMTGELDDYGYIDTAFRILELLKQGGLGEQVKYRALATISGFINATSYTETDTKLEAIIQEIEDL